MDTLVSARIAPMKKEALQRRLEGEGLTISQLINSAIDYYLAAGELPAAEAERALRDDSSFVRYVQASTLDVDWGTTGDDPADYKRMLKQGRLCEYESLA